MSRTRTTSAVIRKSLASGRALEIVRARNPLLGIRDRVCTHPGEVE